MLKELTVALDGCDVNLSSLLTVPVENNHALAHMRHPTFSYLEYAQDFGQISKEAFKRTAKWTAKYSTNRDSYYPMPSSNAIDLNEISVMKNEHVTEQLLNKGRRESHA